MTNGEIADWANRALEVVRLYGFTEIQHPMYTAKDGIGKPLTKEQEHLFGAALEFLQQCFANLTDSRLMVNTAQR